MEKVALAALLLMLVLLTPSAEALQTLTPGPGGSSYLGYYTTGKYTFPNEGTETYGFNLNGLNGFNLSAPYSQNDSIHSWGAALTVSKPITFSAATYFDFLFQWNGSETVDLHESYYPHWRLFTSSWEITETVTYDGVQMCSGSSAASLTSTNNVLNSATDLILGHTISPVPGAIVSRGYTGLTAPVADANTTANSTGLTFSFNPDTFQRGDLCRSTVVINGVSAFVNTNGFSINGLGNLTGALSVTISSSDTNLYSQDIIGVFGNNTQTSGALGNATNNGGLSSSSSVCSFGLNLFQDIESVMTCIVKTVALDIFNLLYGLVAGIVTILFNLIPGGQVLEQAFLFPFTFLLDFLTFLLQVYLQDGPNYPGGGTWFMLLLWSVGAGLSISSFTGDLAYAWKVPFGFIKGSTVGTGLFLYWVFWILPTKAFSLIIDTVRAIRG